MFSRQTGLHPAIYMIIAVVSFSAFPILFNLGEADESPLLFVGVWQAGVGLGAGGALLLFKRKLLFSPGVIEDITRECTTWWMLGSVVGACGFAFFALGLAFVDVSLAAILYEIWPLLLILLAPFLFKDNQRYDPTSVVTWFFIAVAVVGVVLVILSHNDAPQPLLDIGADFSNPRTLIGIALVLVTAIGQAALAAFTLKMGDSLAAKNTDLETPRTNEIVFTMVMACICHAIGGAVLCVIGLIVSGTLSLNQLYYAILGGFFVTSIGTFTFRVANLSTRNLGVNALAFATPLVALGWLWLFEKLSVTHLDYLIIGAMGIVASNMLINAKADQRIAYNALVVSLWSFGTFVYFHDGYTTDVPLELPVTVFILVLSFRVDRLARRTFQEEEWVFAAFRKLELLVAKGYVESDAWKGMLLEIDRHKKQHDLMLAYEGLTAYLARQMKQAHPDKAALDEITDVRYLVDNIAHSRQQGAHFGEIVAIALTGALIVTGLMVFNGEREIYGDITSFVLASVLVFLFFNIIDLQRDRGDRILKDGGKEHGGEFMVKFDDKSTSRKGQRWISVVTSGIIVLVFAWLFTWERVPF